MEYCNACGEWFNAEWNAGKSFALEVTKRLSTCEFCGKGPTMCQGMPSKEAAEWYRETLA